MVNANLIEEKQEKLQKIRNYLFHNCQEGVDAKSLAESKIGKELDLDWQQAKRYLEEIERENLVHGRNFGNTRVYTPNGKPVDEHKVDIGLHKHLYIDHFPGPYGRPFIRIAEKRDGQTTGSVIVPVDKIKEFSQKFTKVSKELNSKS